MIYLFIWERGREGERARGGAEGENLRQASTECRARHGAGSHEP